MGRLLHPQIKELSEELSQELSKILVIKLLFYPLELELAFSNASKRSDERLYTVSLSKL